jgi:hypothetical protein
MSNGKKLKLKRSREEWEWSIKVLREVIFPEIYERYGPNAPPNMQLPTETLQELRRQVYGYEDVQPLKTSESGLNKDDKPKHLGFVMINVVLVLYLI